MNHIQFALTDEQSGKYFFFFGVIPFIIFLVGLGLMTHIKRKRAASQGAASANPRYKEPSIDHLTEDEVAAIERYNDLFENVPLRGGREWQSLDSEELATVCLNAAGPVFKMNHGRYTMREVIENAASRCEGLANWMDQKKYSSFYMGSDMSAYISKPRLVATRLRRHIAFLEEHAEKEVPPPALVTP